MQNQLSPLFRFRAVLLLFVVGLVISGVTAFPLLLELRVLTTLLGVGAAHSPQGYTGLPFWIITVRCGLEQTYGQYPWLAYGTDWLAFAHIVIAFFFIGPLIDPASGRWPLRAGILACFSVLPLALICGPLRGIPFYWRLIDCCFGVFGAIPLIYCLRLLPRIQKQAAAAKG